MAAKDEEICNCKVGRQFSNGWEGTALLQHGVLMRFGCLSFVFAITEYDDGNEDAMNFY